MAYTRPTISEIHNRVKADMESRLTGGKRIPSVSWLSVVSLVIAGASFLVYGFIDWIYRQIFISTADEEGLQRRAESYRLPRKAATFASGEVSFTGTAGVTVVSGTQIVSSTGAVYETESDFIIGTTASVTAGAIVAGSAGNTTDPTLDLVTLQTGVNGAANVASGFDDGQDQETIEDWRVRLLQRAQNPPSSGNAADYERWALEVAGVGYAKCFPSDLWGTIGTVGVAVSSSDRSQLPSGIVTNCQTYIDTKKPKPSSVLVYSPDESVIDFDISITPNTSVVQDAVEDAVAALYSADAEPGATMFISRLQFAIAGAGVSNFVVNDIEVDTVSIGAVDYTVDKFHVPKIGTFTFSAVP